MVHVKDLSPDQRVAIDGIPGRALRDDQILTSRPSKIIKQAPRGADRTVRCCQYPGSLDRIAERVKDVPEAEFDAAIDEALNDLRHHRSGHVMALSPFIIGE